MGVIWVNRGQVVDSLLGGGVNGYCGSPSVTGSGAVGITIAYKWGNWVNVKFSSCNGVSVSLGINRCAPVQLFCWVRQLTVNQSTVGSSRIGNQPQRGVNHTWVTGPGQTGTGRGQGLGWVNVNAGTVQGTGGGKWATRSGHLGSGSLGNWSGGATGTLG